MFGHDQSMKMNSRSGLPIKNIVTAVCILLCVYLLYIYNVAQNRLHDAELTSARYRREVDEKGKEIQDIVGAKDDFQERCETEKRELNNRLKSINQKHTMLQSQNTEIEADFMKLKQDMENLKTEHMQTESQHAQEYQTLKQTKEKEILDLNGQVNNMKNGNDELQKVITSLRSQLQTFEAANVSMQAEHQQALQMIDTLQSAKKNLVDQNAQLQMLQFQQQKQMQLQKQNEENAKQAQALQQQQQQINVVSEHQNDPLKQQQQHPNGVNPDVDHMSMGKAGDQENPGAAAGVVVDAGNANVNQGGDNPIKNDASNLDRLNSLNQAQPPNMNPAVDESKVQNVGGDDHRAEVNPNDLQKGQILEPLKQDGAEADGEGKMNLREQEEKREKEELDNQAPEHNKDPLALGQMQQPLGFDGNDQEGGDNQEKLGQQQPPNVEEKKLDEGNGLDAAKGKVVAAAGLTK